MENAIKYYYNLDPINIETLDNGYLFRYKDEIYYMYMLYGIDDKRLKEVYELNKKMLSNNILIHEILLNKVNQVVTVLDGKFYVLMRININLDKKINLSDISYFQYISKFLVSKKDFVGKSWGVRWAKKIDYYEQQAIEIGRKYPIALECFNYFIGISENAIMYINEIVEIPEISYCHIRPVTNALDFYNPFNLILDYKVRDISEYLKMCFINDEFDFNEFNTYILNARMSSVDFKYLYARMLFPTYFFDVFERVMERDVDELSIASIVKKIPKFEMFLCDLYSYISNYVVLEKIDWLKKSN